MDFRKHFHKNPLCFWIHAIFEVVIEIDISNIGNETNIIYKQNPAFKAYFILSELNDVLQNEYHESPLDKSILDWFVDQVIEVENEIGFFIKKSKKDIVMTNKDENHTKNNTCRFCEKRIKSDNFGDHCIWLVKTEDKLIENGRIL